MKKTVFLLVCFCLVLIGCAEKGVDGLVVKASQPRLTKLAAGICRDEVTGLMWLEKRSRNITDGNKAAAYAANLGSGGFDDWRLPTLLEFSSLNATCMLHKTGECRIQNRSAYWFTTEHGDIKAGRFVAPDYTCGLQYELEETEKGYVRAVRP
jgi:hypothetical protein